MNVSLQREWAEARKELHEERDSAQALRLDREQTIKDAMKQVEEMGKNLANALHAVSAAETRAALAEVIFFKKKYFYYLSLTFMFIHLAGYV